MNWGADAKIAPQYSPRRAGEPLWVNQEVPSARALVVLSPGVDAEEGWNPRESSRDVAARKVVNTGVTIYGYGFTGLAPDKRLAKAATDSGGWFVVPDRKTDIPGEARRILSDLRNRYVVGFVPTSFDGTVHTLSVKVRRLGVTVRAGTTYIAPKSQ
jgi:hypothetical protein